MVIHSNTKIIKNNNMEVVDFSKSLFQDIPMQDNPAYGNDECIMVVKDSQRQTMFAVLKIDPVADPLEEVSVTKICVVYILSNALKIAYSLSNDTLKE